MEGAADAGPQMSASVATRTARKIMENSKFKLLPKDDRIASQANKPSASSPSNGNQRVHEICPIPGEMEIGSKSPAIAIG
jgi:hypothetical protein